MSIVYAVPEIHVRETGVPKRNPRRGVADRSAVYTTRRSLTEQQIKDARAYHEWFNWTTKACADHFGTSYDNMLRIHQYITARALEPRRCDYPRGPTA